MVSSSLHSASKPGKTHVPRTQAPASEASGNRRRVAQMILKSVAIMALFVVVIVVALPGAIPAEISLSPGVGRAMRVLGGLSILAAFYLTLVLSKNRQVWVEPVRLSGAGCPAVSISDSETDPQGGFFDRLELRIQQVGGRAALIPAILALLWVLGGCLMAALAVNGEAELTFLQLLRLRSVAGFYLPTAVGLFASVLLAAGPLGTTPRPQPWGFVPELSLRGILAGIAAFLATVSSPVAHLIWATGFGPISSTNVLQLADPTSMMVGKADFLRLIASYATVFFLIFIACWLVVGGLFSAIRGVPTLSLAFSTSLLLALVFNYLLQVGMDEPTAIRNHGSVVAGATTFQVAILTMVIMVFYLLINRYILATTLAAVVLGLFAYANQVKFAFRQEPVYPSEMSWLQNPGALTTFVGGPAIFAAIALALIAIVAAAFTGRRLFKGPIMGWKARLAVAAVLAIAYLPFAQNLAEVRSRPKQIEIPVLTSFVNVSNGDILWRGSPYTARTKSLAYLWLRQMNNSVMDQPSGYSAGEISALESKYTDLAETINADRPHEITDYTVIFILSESLANPTRAGGVTLSENPLPHIDEVIGSSTGGLFYSHGFGGGTANMEAQSLTGLPMSTFSDTVSILNSDVLPMMKFIPSISDSFEEKIALHPADAGNYNRKSIYSKLGFDHFYATSSVPEEDLLGKQNLLGAYPSDAQTYADVLERIDPDRNQFFSVLTMQNHMPYNNYEGKSQIEAIGEGYSAAENAKLQNYVRQISDTDQATADFLGELEQIDRPIAVVFYGDHLPRIYPDSAGTFSDDPAAKFQTDYFIWTNDGTGANRQMDLNSAELIPALLETTGSKVSPYYALLTQAMWDLPPQFNSGLHSRVELTPAQVAVLDELKTVQYDLTAGSGFLDSDKEFFSVPGASER